MFQALRQCAWRDLSNYNATIMFHFQLLRTRRTRHNHIKFKMAAAGEVGMCALRCAHALICRGRYSPVIRGPAAEYHHFCTFKAGHNHYWGFYSTFNYKSIVLDLIYDRSCCFYSAITSRYEARLISWVKLTNRLCWL